MHGKEPVGTIGMTGIVEQYDVSDQQEIPLNELRKRRQPLLDSGRHPWVVALYFDVSDDPEADLDHMELGVDRLLGTSPFQCLMCLVRYDITIRDEPCPGGPPEQ